MLESGCYKKWELTNYYTMMKSIYEAQVAAKVDVPVSASVKECRKPFKGLQSRLLESSWGLNGRRSKAAEDLLRALGRLLGGSWHAFAVFQEASWTKDRHIYNFQ